MPVGPNTAAALSFSGILGIYLECLRPGWLVPGCLGIALLLWGSYDLWLYRPTPAGCACFAFSVLLFLLEIFLDDRFLAGFAATAALFASLKMLLPPPHPIHSVFALAIASMLGFATALFCSSARRARKNKRADLFNAR